MQNKADYGFIQIPAPKQVKHGFFCQFFTYRLYAFDSRVQSKAWALWEAEWPPRKYWLSACWLQLLNFTHSFTQKQEEERDDILNLKWNFPIEHYFIIIYLWGSTFVSMTSRSNKLSLHIKICIFLLIASSTKLAWDLRSKLDSFWLIYWQ